MIQILYVKRRKCGFPVPGGTYLVTDRGSEDGALARIVKLDPPIPTQRKPHRGPILVDGARLLAREPEDDWVVGTSAKTVQRKRADAGWQEVFGMPLKQRLSTGDCDGVKTADAAYETLLEKVHFDRTSITYLRQIALEEVQNLPNAAPLYAKIVAGAQQYAMSRGQEPEHLVSVAAACWELFHAVPKKQRGRLTPVANLLAAIGLVKDGKEMLLALAP